MSSVRETYCKLHADAWVEGWRFFERSTSSPRTERAPIPPPPLTDVDWSGGIERCPVCDVPVSRSERVREHSSELVKRFAVSVAWVVGALLAAFGFVTVVGLMRGNS